MKKKYQTILILLIILVIVSGLVLFIFRNQALETLSAQSGVKDITLLNKHNMPLVKNALNTDIFQSATFVSLKNNVINFDFNNICQQNAAQVSPVSIIISNGEANVKSAVNCVLGNNIPFVNAKD